MRGTSGRTEKQMPDTWQGDELLADAIILKGIPAGSGKEGRILQIDV